MNYVIIWLLLAAAVIVLISPIRVWVDYRHRGKTEDTLLVQVGVLWGLGSYSIEVPVISSSPQGVSIQAEAGKSKKRIGIPIPSLKQIRQHLSVVRKLSSSLSKLFKFFSRSIKIKRFVWHTEIGLRDSAALANLSGTIWAVKGMVCAGLQSLFRFTKPPVFRVKPHFNRSYFRTVFTCILEFPLGYAIIATFFAAYLLVKLKLSRRGEVNGGTSNPRADEDSHGKYQRNGGCQYSNR